jgi:hypothetical protein
MGRNRPGFMRMADTCGSYEDEAGSPGAFISPVISRFKGVEDYQSVL